VLQGAALSGVAGWFAIVIGIVSAVGYTIFGDMPPFVSYLPTGLLGIIVLLQRSTRRLTKFGVSQRGEIRFDRPPTANEAPPQTDETCPWLNRRRLRRAGRPRPRGPGR
jgi:hypothetical protein